MAVIQELTLYDRVGGASALEAVVDAFYDRVMADDHLEAFFRQTDMKRQRTFMRAFLAMALGGPNEYDGRPMKETHEHLGVTELHFALIAGHLAATLEAAGVSQDMVNEIVGVMAPLKPVVVTA